jgi:hypothetical protein
MNQVLVDEVTTTSVEVEAAAAPIAYLKVPATSGLVGAK